MTPPADTARDIAKEVEPTPGTYAPPADARLAAIERLVFDFGMASVRAAHCTHDIKIGTPATPEQRHAREASCDAAWSARMAAYVAIRTARAEADARIAALEAALGAACDLAETMFTNWSATDRARIDRNLGNGAEDEAMDEIERLRTILAGAGKVGA